MSLTSTTRISPMGQAVPEASLGLFGTIGDILGGAAKIGGGLLTGGIPGAIGAAGQVFGGGDGGGGQQAPATPPTFPGRFPTRPAPPGVTGPGGQETERIFSGIQAGPIELGREREIRRQARAAPSPNGQIGCPKGMRPNKTSYFLKDGTFVPEGSKCVKVRRRNPANMKALSRALSRLDSAKRLQAKLRSYSTKKYTAAGKRKKC